MGKERLARPGFYLRYLSAKTSDPTEYLSVEYIDPCLKLKYIGASHCEWDTLMWSSGLTKKQLQVESKLKDSEEDMRSMYFRTHGDLLKHPRILTLLPNCIVDPATLIK